MKASLRLRPMLILVSLLMLVSCASSAMPTKSPLKATPVNGTYIPVRFAAIANASQSYIPYIMSKMGIDHKYGFEVKLVELSASNQQWTALRANEADVASGSFLDLLRQRQAGLQTKAFRGFYAFSNPVIAPASKQYISLSDLRGAKVGTPSATSLDWMILRAAGKKGGEFDIGTDAQVSESSQQLLTQLLLREQLDAALQFSSLAFEPVAEGKLREITNVKAVLTEAGFDADAFYLQYNIVDTWRERFGNSAVAALVAAMDEAVDVLLADDSVWPELAKRSGMENMALMPQFIASQREYFKVTYNRSKLQPTQLLLDELVKTVGVEVLGVTKVDPEAFDFESVEAARGMRR